jgi:hypothetical protein
MGLFIPTTSITQTYDRGLRSRQITLVCCGCQKPHSSGGKHRTAVLVYHSAVLQDDKCVFLGCWASLDEQDRLCEASLDSSTVEVSGSSDQQIDSIFQACMSPMKSDTQTTDLSLVPHHRVEIRREGDGDVPSNPIIILEDTPSVTVAANTNKPPQSPPQRPEKRLWRPKEYLPYK